MPRSEKFGIGFCVLVLGIAYIACLIHNPEGALGFAVFWMISGFLVILFPRDRDIDPTIDGFDDIVFYVLLGPILWVVALIVYVSRYLDTGSFEFKDMP